MERRVMADARMEVRQEGERPVLRGYAAVYGQWSEDLGGFRERIAPGAFGRALAGADVRALWNHDSAFVLGRTKAGTLRLRDDEHGLFVEIDPPDSLLGQAWVESVRRGDVSQMSFAFSIEKAEHTWGEDGTREQTLRDVTLFEVSPVTFPAYPQTELDVRALWPERDGHNGQAPVEAEGSAEAEETQGRLDVLRKRLDLEMTIV